jgi:hypothetical protein
MIFDVRWDNDRDLKPLVLLCAGDRYQRLSTHLPSLLFQVKSARFEHFAAPETITCRAAKC